MLDKIMAKYYAEHPEEFARDMEERRQKQILAEQKARKKRALVIAIVVFVAVVLAVLVAASILRHTKDTETVSAPVTRVIEASVTTPTPTTSAGTPISDDPSLYEITQIETPGSTCFSSIGYDSGTGTLVVTFRDSGASYAYDEVPKSVWNKLKNADSMGGYYNKNIKGQYDCTKLG